MCCVESGGGDGGRARGFSGGGGGAVGGGGGGGWARLAHDLSARLRAAVAGVSRVRGEGEAAHHLRFCCGGLFLVLAVLVLLVPPAFGLRGHQRDV
ncbi:hypothetical protein FJT64_005302 [Amphibalanus amphitrite]|uniref:Uncharacterized protein n=1 Tax=Amphibalanus amphitrite TaxID=1232801 RepID=A0A6A4W5D0_AMPAM|nr:hypothetical protein FJT64_005302 [Amphibalanus amphitrite]